MKKEFLRKLMTGFFLVWTLGVAACGESGGGDFSVDDEDGFAEPAFAGPSDQPWAVHTSGGSVVGQGDFTGAVFNDGTGVTCGPDGGCIY